MRIHKQSAFATAMIFTATLLVWQPRICRAETRVLIIVGSGGQKEFVESFQQQAQQLQEILQQKYGYRPADIILLKGDPAQGAKTSADNSAGGIRRAFDQLRQQLRPRDGLMVFLIGHGSYDDEWAKFNIPGPDLRDIDFAGLLDGLPTQNILFINTTSASGPFLEKLSGKGRIIITATENGLEKNATHFAENLLRAISQGELADLNKDGQLSAAEAFVFSRDQLVRYYEEKRQLRPEHPVLDDDGDGVGSQTPDLVSGDGARSAHFYLAQARDNQAPTGPEPAAEPLSAEKQKILDEVRRLQARKSSMPEEVYYKEFEKLMLQLAKMNAGAVPQK